MNTQTQKGKVAAPVIKKDQKQVANDAPKEEAKKGSASKDKIVAKKARKDTPAKGKEEVKSASKSPAKATDKKADKKVKESTNEELKKDKGGHDKK